MKFFLATTGFLVLLVHSAAFAEDLQDNKPLTREQRFIVAAFNLDVERVKKFLSEGIEVNARMGKHGERLFMDKWSLGYPCASAKWTALLAVASSHCFPQPEHEAENTVEGLNKAKKERAQIPQKLVKERDERRVEIAKLLIKARADLDVDDGFGATALYEAIYDRYDGLALLLIESGAKVNSKTGVYIDGTGDITPLHRATGSPKILKELLAHGADVSSRDSEGETALLWAVRAAKLESVHLLIKAGADLNVMDKEGRTPQSLAATWGKFDSKKKEFEEIEEILRKASKK